MVPPSYMQSIVEWTSLCGA